MPKRAEASSAPAHLPADVAEKAVTSEPNHENPRAFVPEPMPLAEAVEIPLPIHRGGLLRALSFLLAHQMRTVTYVPVLVVALALRPKQTAIALGVYWGVLCPRLAWKQAVHKWLAWASSNKPRLLNCMRQKAYDPSKQYLVAWHPKSSTENERTTLVFDTLNHGEVMIRQIAGAVARRIAVYVKPGQPVSVGEDVGFIRFGSRVDIFLPLDAEVLCKIGDKPSGGETVIAKLQPTS